MTRAYKPKVGEAFDAFDKQKSRKAQGCPCEAIKVLGRYSKVAMDGQGNKREFLHQNWYFKPNGVEDESKR